METAFLILMLATAGILAVVMSVMFLLLLQEMWIKRTPWPRKSPPH
jgi:hypothetical protein